MSRRRSRRRRRRRSRSRSRRKKGRGSCGLAAAVASVGGGGGGGVTSWRGLLAEEVTRLLEQPLSLLQRVYHPVAGAVPGLSLKLRML